MFTGWTEFYPQKRRFRAEESTASPQAEGGWCSAGQRGAGLGPHPPNVLSLLNPQLWAASGPFKSTIPKAKSWPCEGTCPQGRPLPFTLHRQRCPALGGNNLLVKLELEIQPAERKLLVRECRACLLSGPCDKPMSYPGTQRRGMTGARTKVQKAFSTEERALCPISPEGARLSSRSVTE